MNLNKGCIEMIITALINGLANKMNLNKGCIEILNYFLFVLKHQ